MITVCKNGRNIVGCKIICNYQGSKDPAPIKIEGNIVNQRKIENKGNLLVVETANGFRSIYFEKATDILFYAQAAKFHNTDDGHDAQKDARLVRYGI